MSKKVLSKCSFIWNNEPVNIWNNLKAKKYTSIQIYVLPVNIFLFLFVTLPARIDELIIKFNEIYGVSFWLPCRKGSALEWNLVVYVQWTIYVPFQYKHNISQYENSHDKDNTVERSSLSYS